MRGGWCGCLGIIKGLLGHQVKHCRGLCARYPAGVPALRRCRLQEKSVVAHVLQQRLCSVRRACTYLGLPRSTYRYAPKPLTVRQEQLYQRIITLSWHHPRYGYRRICALLAREGWTVSRKQVQRIRRREGLKVRPKPKKIPRRGLSTRLPTQAIHGNTHAKWSQ